MPAIIDQRKAPSERDVKRTEQNMCKRTDSTQHIPFRSLLGFSIALAPVLMLASDVAALVLGEAAFWFATITMWLAFYVFVGAAAGMAALSGWSRIALVGLLLVVFGSMAGTTIMGLERMAWSMSIHEIPKEVIREVISEPAVFLTSRVIGLTFPIGLLLLTWSLVRKNVLAPVTGLILALGVILFPVGRIFAGLPANVAGDALMVLVMVPFGLKAAKGSTLTVSRQ